MSMQNNENFINDVMKKYRQLKGNPNQNIELAEQRMTKFTKMKHSNNKYFKRKSMK